MKKLCKDFCKSSLKVYNSTIVCIRLHSMNWHILLCGSRERGI